MKGTKSYFISDLHLGLDTQYSSSLDREKKVFRWMEMIQMDAKELFLVGDIFDYWFEYHSTIPKGFSRFWCGIRQLVDNGVNVYFFKGNHDMWVFDYFEKEYGIKTYGDTLQIQIGLKKYMIGHGDGLGPGDNGYKLMKKIFRSPVSQALFSFIPSSMGLGLMRKLSYKDRLNPSEQEPFADESRERLISYAQQVLSMGEEIDFFVFGHRHLPIVHRLSNDTSYYINLGEWMYACSYGMATENGMTLNFFESEYQIIYGNES